MITLNHKDLLDAGVHFGHLARKWHPNMAPFIFMESNGIHIIDLNKTLVQLQKATHALKAIASAGKRILFVATKTQAKGVVEQEAKRLGMPYITERWLGGTLTNFATIRRLLKKMSSFDKLIKSTAYDNMAKKEQLMIAREKTKLERLLQGIADTTRLPAALFIVDVKKEHIAVKEAKKLGIPVFALTDTNTDPTWVDYPIPSNDDASRSVELIVKAVGSAIEDGLEERREHKEVDTLAQGVIVSKGVRERNVEKVVSSETVEKQAFTAKYMKRPITQAAKKVITQRVAEVSAEITESTSKAKATTTSKQPNANVKKTAKKETPDQE
jgi:small subunit ribosomal protein S2